MKGRENVYVCPVCQGFTVTVDVDEGVTPAFIDCRASGNERDCLGMAASSFYPEGPRPAHIPPPAWEWYKPTITEARAEDRKFSGMADPARRGGLFLRRRQTRQEGARQADSSGLNEVYP